MSRRHDKKHILMQLLREDAFYMVQEGIVVLADYPFPDFRDLSYENCGDSGASV